jgi:cysteinylglycine-S-conjugate dipeptidase
VDDLKSLVAIPSVSFKPYPPSHVWDSAQKVAELMAEAGLENIDIFSLEGSFPYVVADWLHAKEAPTLLLYAHHDVQPPMREECWNSPVFEPTERNGRLYGRGTADDKAGVLVHLASIKAWLKTVGELPVNIRLIIEGEEEIGSPHLQQLLDQYTHRLKADAVLVVDLQNFSAGQPTLTNSLRGMVCCEIELKALKSALHSGLWGGPVPDPTLALCRLLSTLSDSEGQIAISGIIDELEEPSSAERMSWDKLKMNEEIFKAQTGMLDNTRCIDPQHGLLEKLWRRPSLSINTFVAGSKENAGNVIQDKAWARIGLRLAPGMDPHKTQALMEQHLQKNCPWGLQLSLRFDAAVPAWSTTTDHPMALQLMQALSEGYGQEAVFAGCGATIPLAGPMSKALGDVPVFLIGIEDPESKAHSENESLLLSEFKKAIASQVIFFHKLNKTT